MDDQRWGVTCKGSTSVYKQNSCVPAASKWRSPYAATSGP
jgi:hypothetical protein